MSWRKDRLPPLEEFAAVALERQDLWLKAQLDLAAGKRFFVPNPVQIVRPGDKPRGRNVVNDPRQIAAALQKLIG